MNQETVDFIAMCEGLHIKLANMDFEKFKIVMKNAMQVTEIYEDYALDKFKSMRNDIGTFLFSELDNTTRYHFINQIILELQLKR